ncbi:MAG: ABC transporter permease [Planctomycetota bacterium]|nr:MAG: ABC transporter permease [Planctomycetota bacterium]
MPPGELFPLVWESIRSRPLRSILTTLGIVVGMAAVVLLSSIGEGSRRAIAEQFSQFGTTIVAITPGKAETFGIPGILGTEHPLTLEDGRALARIPGVRRLTANLNGAARVEYRDRGRDVYCFGVMHEAQYVWHWGVRSGQFLPPGDPELTPPVAVLGATLARELFGARSPLGQTVRVGEARFRVIGVMEPKGTFLGIDLDDAAYIPIVRAMRLFGREEIDEIDLDVASHDMIPVVVERVRKVLSQRHGGREDFTIVTQDAMLEVIGNVMGMITRGVVAIAAVAILVGAIGILTVTWLSVHERTAEIGLMKAVGASDGQILALFLGEAVALGLLGGLGGIAAGLGIGWVLERAIPLLQTELPLGVLWLCLLVSVGVGAGSGWLPARRAARLDPVVALREE